MAETTLALSSFRDLRTLAQLPLVRQLVLIAALAVAVGGGMMMFNWTQQPNYLPLYPGLDEQDSAALADALRTANIPYRIDNATGTVTVPGDKIYEARMRAAAQGLPRSSSMGFEMMQQQEGFGTSQFMEMARYQLALETELARTISSLQPVKGARVHLALPKPSAFAQGNSAPSASVLVELQPGRQLEANQVASIEHMVASSVPNLVPGAVTVIDQFGRLLSSDDRNNPLVQSTEQYQYEQRIEDGYVRRIQELLTPMLGPDHISTQVVADLDFAQTEEASETYNPQNTAVRSEQTSEDVTRGANGASGIPGATSNQPPAPSGSATPTPPAPAPQTNANAANGAAAGANAANPAAGAAGAASATSSSDNTISQNRSATRNYEVDRTVSHTRHPVGRLRKLSVAVLVDNWVKLDDKGQPVSTPLTPEELAKVEALVKQAVGFDTTRGDSVTVQNAAFQTLALPAPVPLPIWKRPEFRDYLRQGLGTLIVLILIFAVLRPLLRSLLGVPHRLGVEESAAAEALTDAAELGEEQLALSTEGSAVTAAVAQHQQHQQALAPPPYQEKLVQARAAVTEDAKRVAQVVKTWLNENG